METSNCELNNITYKLFPYKFQLQSQNLVVFGSFCLNIKKSQRLKLERALSIPWIGLTILTLTVSACSAPRYDVFFGMHISFPAWLWLFLTKTVRLEETADTLSSDTLSNLLSPSVTKSCKGFHSFKLLYTDKLNNFYL